MLFCSLYDPLASPFWFYLRFHVPQQPTFQRQACQMSFFGGFLQQPECFSPASEMTFVLKSFLEFLVLGVLFNGRLIILEKETRGRKMDFRNNIPSGCEEQSFFWQLIYCFHSVCIFPLSLSLYHWSMTVKETSVMITSAVLVRRMSFIAFEVFGTTLRFGLRLQIQEMHLFSCR